MMVPNLRFEEPDPEKVIDRERMILQNYEKQFETVMYEHKLSMYSSVDSRLSMLNLLNSLRNEVEFHTTVLTALEDKYYSDDENAPPTKEELWAEYIDYLHKWAKHHKKPGFFRHESAMLWGSGLKSIIARRFTNVIGPGTERRKNE